MSKVTITITDTDVNSGEFKVDFHAQGSEIDEGVATAAYFTAYYLYTQAASERTITGVSALANEIGRLMDKDSETPVLSPTKPARAFLVLEDVNPDTGQFQCDLTFDGGHPEGDRLPTAAVVVGLYMRNLLGSLSFQMECWEFAEKLAEEKGATIANPQSAPSFNGAAE